MLESINTVLMALLPIALLIIGLLAFLVSAVTQVIKNVGVLARVPTDILVILLAVAFTLALLFAWAAYAAVSVPWYYVLAAVIAGFMVAYVAMFGWTKLYALYVRFKGPKE